MKFAALHRTRLAVAVSAAALSLAAGHALGSNFALQEQSGSGVGNAFAGGAAAAEDASTVWSNPAGMSRIPGIQGVIAGDVVCISANFNNNGGSAATGATPAHVRSFRVSISSCRSTSNSRSAWESVRRSV
jgi:long-subunit fatty acid transport protein